jgi:hypothetical protein
MATDSRLFSYRRFDPRAGSGTATKRTHDPLRACEAQLSRTDSCDYASDESSLMGPSLPNHVT